MQTTTYADSELTSVHVNLPSLLWRATATIAKRLATTKTNVVVRALDNYAYFTRALLDDPSARVLIVHTDGTREYVPFPELYR